MFTGIVEEIGKVKKIQRGAKSSKLTITASQIFQDLKLGDSISTNGVCLTVSSFSGQDFTADIMHESLERSNLGELKLGGMVNLERATLANGRLGGHIVSGHIDGRGKILEIKKDDNAIWYKIEADSELMKYIVEKGSVAIDGISLTVAKLSKQNFSVSVIPHTISNTILPTKKVGDKVNLENDIVGKYVEKLLFSDQKGSGQLTKEKLAIYGF